MKKAAVSVWTIVTFLIGTLVGGFWEWKKIEIESQGQEIERAVKTADLREKENDQYAKILELTNEYIKAVDDYSKAPKTPLSDNIELRNTIVQLKSRLDVMKDNFKALENKLARLEGRQPRDIQIDFIPPAPPTSPKAVAF